MLELDYRCIVYVLRDYFKTVSNTIEVCKFATLQVCLTNFSDTLLPDYLHNNI